MERVGLGTVLPSRAHPVSTMESLGKSLCRRKRQKVCPQGAAACLLHNRLQLGAGDSRWEASLAPPLQIQPAPGEVEHCPLSAGKQSTVYICDQLRQRRLAGNVAELN